MQLAEEILVKSLKVYGDSKLTVNQVVGSMKSDMNTWCLITMQPLIWRRSLNALHWPYTTSAKCACRCIDISRCFIGPSSQSHRESTCLQPWLVLPKIRLWGKSYSKRRPSSWKSSGDFNRFETQGWRFSFIDFVLYSILPDDSKEAAANRRKAPQFYYNAITRALYRWSYDEILLCHLSYKEAQETLREAHSSMYGAHQPGPKLGDRRRKLGYSEDDS